MVVHNIARRRSGPGLAEDIAQVVRSNAVRNFRKLDPPKGVYAYICGGIVNVWRRVLRER
ncbi:sigma factor [Gemmata algarum]|uniref:sigma factor n=1 Tax=Gemmata algarum TaxID=2975278 RepID=UPI0039C8D9C2